MLKDHEGALLRAYWEELDRWLRRRRRTEAEVARGIDDEAHNQDPSDSRRGPSSAAEGAGTAAVDATINTKGDYYSW